MNINTSLGNSAVTETTTLRQRKNKTTNKSTDKTVNSVSPSIIANSNPDTQSVGNYANAVNSTFSKGPVSKLPTQTPPLSIKQQPEFEEQEERLDCDALDNELYAYPEIVITQFKNEIKKEIEYLNKEPKIDNLAFAESALKHICWINDHLLYITDELECLKKDKEDFVDNDFNDKQIERLVKICLFSNNKNNNILINSDKDANLIKIKKNQVSNAKKIICDHESLYSAWEICSKAIKNLSERSIKFASTDPIIQSLITERTPDLDSKFKKSTEDKLKLNIDFLSKTSNQEQIRKLKDEIYTYRHKAVNSTTVHLPSTKEEYENFRSKVCGLMSQQFKSHLELMETLKTLKTPLSSIEKSCSMVGERRNKYIEKINELTEKFENNCEFLLEQLTTLDYDVNNPEMFIKHDRSLKGWVPSIMGGVGTSTEASKVWGKRLPTPFLDIEETAQQLTNNNKEKTKPKAFNPKFIEFCKLYNPIDEI